LALNPDECRKCCVTSSGIWRGKRGRGEKKVREEEEEVEKKGK
jgi:hypothetical protein